MAVGLSLPKRWQGRQGWQNKPVAAARLAALALAVAALHVWIAGALSAALNESASANAGTVTAVTTVTRIEASHAGPVPSPAPKPLRTALPTSPPPSPPTSPQNPPPTQAAPDGPPPRNAMIKAAHASPSGASRSAADELQATPPEASPPDLAWPVAWRVSYGVTGRFQGQVQGSATLEWAREGDRYQLRIEAVIGARAPAATTWSLFSEGRIEAAGLAPQRFAQIDRFTQITAAPRTLEFEDAEVVLDAGQRVARPAGMQDGASQILQLAHRLEQEPTLAQTGRLIGVPLAGLAGAQTVDYRVAEPDMLRTPVGTLATVHVRPERMNINEGLPAIEIWFAPALHHLPVRIRIHGPDRSVMDLDMDRSPETL